VWQATASFSILISHAVHSYLALFWLADSMGFKRIPHLITTVFSKLILLTRHLDTFIVNHNELYPFEPRTAPMPPRRRIAGRPLKSLKQTPAIASCALLQPDAHNTHLFIKSCEKLRVDSYKPCQDIYPRKKFYSAFVICKSQNLSFSLGFLRLR